jgi:hypothetical protein
MDDLQIYSTDNGLSVDAHATLINLLPSGFALAAPSLPFTISLPFGPEPNATINSTTPDPVPIVAITSAPFTLTNSNTNLSLTGHVLPLPHSATPALSAFLSMYLSARPAPILIASPVLPALSLPAQFPPPRVRPRILRNVTLTDMQLTPVGTRVLASGTVTACVVLPHGINPRLAVERVLPDVLVFDGAVSEHEDDADPVSWIGALRVDSRWTRRHTIAYDDDEGDDVPPPRPLPDPLPDRAFAHIRPDAWVRANSTPDDPARSGDDAADGTAVDVVARLEDVPLRVLPGRQRQFSAFVSKVVFGAHGALAGVQGVAAVGVQVDGLAGGMVLTGLPFRGNVRIGGR